MDKKIRQIQREVPKKSKAHKDLKKLEAADHKRDKVCDYGKKMLKKKHK